MKLLFDLKATQPNISGKRHGGGRYGEVIFYRMIERDIKFSCFYDSKLWLNPDIKNACDKNNIPLYDLQNEGTVEQIIHNHKFDRLYSCLPGNLAKIDSCEVYGTIHGLREFETPFDNIYFQYEHKAIEYTKFFIKKILRKWVLRRNHKRFLETYIKSKFHLITVSEHSKYAFYSYFPELKDTDIPVFYSPNTSINEVPSESNIKEKYFLLVSGNRWEKNNLRAIIAFDRLMDYKCMNGIRMKITGSDGSNYHYKIKHPERFDFVGYVDEKELNTLYRNAFLFIYPSLNEGFGYPPIEAMKYGIPVIASPYSSMAEICGSGALYFNPTSIEEIMNRMLMMTCDSNLYSEYVKKSYSQYNRIKQRQDKDLDTMIEYICKI